MQLPYAHDQHIRHDDDEVFARIALRCNDRSKLIYLFRARCRTTHQSCEVSESAESRAHQKLSAEKEREREGKEESYAVQGGAMFM